MSVAPLKAAIRPPLVDGLFYPARREALAAHIDDLLTHASTRRAASFAIITPHAGYDFAGGVMAEAFASIALRPVRTAVLIGPVHRDARDGIFLPESEAFATPLGDIPVDTRSVAALAAFGAPFQRSDIPHLEEHCLELQLPFLARMFPGVSIVPLLIGTPRAATVTALARALRLTFADSADYTAYIVSANIASYMSGRNVDAENAAMESLLESGDWHGMVAASEKRQISACCVAGIAAVLCLAGPGCRVQVRARASSRPPEADDSRIVHYAGVSIDTREME
jgi:AmmeMemoRadiSam system protein B